MAIWKPQIRVKSNAVLELNRGNPVVYTYTLPGQQVFPEGATPLLTLFNTYGQTLDSWAGTVAGGVATFSASASSANAIPTVTSWVLTAVMGSHGPQILTQGTVLRNEAPFPDAPGASGVFDGVRYGYNFGTPGLLVDPSWRRLNGNPRVYDNSSLSLPNAVAAGSINGGDLAVYDDVGMLYYAPLSDDAVRLTYNVVKGLSVDKGEAWIVICSNYDMSNSAAIYHEQHFGAPLGDGATIGIATGSGPVTYVTRESVSHGVTSLDSFTAEYNPSSNTYAVYEGTDTTPIVSWHDSTEIVSHGAGETYVGFAFKSGALFPGVEISDWIISDSV